MECVSKQQVTNFIILSTLSDFFNLIIETLVLSPDTDKY